MMATADSPLNFSLLPSLQEAFDSQPYQVRRIENTEDKEAIKNSLGSTFTLMVR